MQFSRLPICLYRPVSILSIPVMVSGSTAATNADTLIFNVMYAFYTGCSSFMSQNYGARNKKRVLKSYFISLFYSFTTGLILGLLLFIFGHQFLSLFATDAAVIDAGMQRIKIMAFSYCVSVFYGLHDRSFARNRKDYHPDDHYHSWDPACSVSYGSTPYLPGFIPSQHCFFCICSPGSSHPSRRLLTLSSSTGNSDPVDDFFILSTNK